LLLVLTNFDLIDFPAHHKSESSLDFLSLSDIGSVGVKKAPQSLYVVGGR
jgi:hypothetical protein